MNKTKFLSVQLTESAAMKVKILLTQTKNDLMKLRVYIISGGCSGLQYGFILDDKFNDNDHLFKQFGVQLVVDDISLQYLNGSTIDYQEKLLGSRFVLINLKSKITCSCGLSFSV